jgi:hypothetical protein
MVHPFAAPKARPSFERKGRGCRLGQPDRKQLANCERRYALDIEQSVAHPLVTRNDLCARIEEGPAGRCAGQQREKRSLVENFVT